EHLIGAPANRGIEHAQPMRILRVAQQVALGLEAKSGGQGGADDDFGVDAMQRLGVAYPRSGFRDVIDDHELPARLKRLEHRPYDPRNIRRSHERVIEIMEIE